MEKNEAAAALGALGGKAKSAAKTAAVKENGKLGGRPRKGTIRWMNPVTGSLDTAEGWQTDYEETLKAGELEEWNWGDAWNSRLVEVVYDGHEWVEKK